ncbi:hypothetical protein L3X38_033451 [Prunus dulcis]|uniref:Protein FAR1-RELATED SEQUENCE n=1 Tax=Prunus dulcis TaxID=3755 RepID=A0AAD4VG72_PRUDU|nr:hypothetical protein L3X38_033451 [Prunus dulcis]
MSRMTTAPSSDPPAQSASAATAPALLDHVVVGPGPSQAPASSASSVAQPASARRRHRPTDTIDTTLTDGTGASGSQPGLNCKNCEMECEGQVILEVSSDFKSKLRLEFDCCEDVFNFYNMYAAKAEFGNRCSTTRICTLTKEVKDKNKYIVVGFNEVHNHDMTTVDKVHLLRSYRNLTESIKVYSTHMSKVNIHVHKQVNLLEVQVGGLENVGFVKRDVYNYARDMRER